MLSADFSDIMMIVIFITFKALIKNERISVSYMSLGYVKIQNWSVNIFDL